MKEIVLTSSILILVLIGLRALFRNKVSRRLIYGMWLLVALRLLIPVQFGSFQFSILNQAEPVTQAITDVAQSPIAGPSRDEISQQIVIDHISKGQEIFIPEVQTQINTQLSQGSQSIEDIYDQVLKDHKWEDVVLPDVQPQLKTEVNNAVAAPTLGQIGRILWIIGTIGMAGWFLTINISCYLKLKKYAEPVEIPDCPLPVKTYGGLTSPCLFGLFHPTIYLTPTCNTDIQTLRHVLAHEQTHFKHADHIWALVRGLCLCIYWFNPLVWIAAGLSKRDCELACDESAIQTLGEPERLAYGKTLVDMVASSTSPNRFLETATAMHESKKQLKERVNAIVKKRKFFLWAAICLMLVAALITGCAFAGIQPSTEPQEQLSIEDEIKQAYYYQESDYFRSHYSLDDLSLRFRGAFSDSYVVFVDGPFGYFAWLTSETVGGLTFTYPDSQQAKVYHQGNFYAMTEAYELGLLTTDNLLELHTKYSGNLNQNKDKGEVPTVRQRCTHPLIPPTEPTTPTETTAPTEPLSIEELMPDIPATTTLCGKPEILSADTLVSTIYDREVHWTGKDGMNCGAFVELPAIVPFCQGAIDINESIRKTNQYKIENIRYSYTNKLYPDAYLISYEATLNGDILCIKITWCPPSGFPYESIWALNVATGEALDTADLAKMYLQESYPTFLQHCAYNLVEYFKANPLYHADEQEALLKALPNDTFVISSFALYLDEEGTLILNLYIHDLKRPYDNNIPVAELDIYGFEGTEESGYPWLFHLQTDGAYSDNWSTLLLDSFLHNPVQFVKMLSKEDADTISDIAGHLNYALYSPEQIALYTALCESIRDTAGNKQYSETAQILLDNIHPL